MKKIIVILSVLLMSFVLSMETFAEDNVIVDEIENQSEILNNNSFEETGVYEKINIPVEDIELSEFENEMYINDTQNLMATVIPQNATEQTIQYSSSNSSVATITQSGKLTAVSSGKCQINVACGGVSVSYDLKVKVRTERINVKSKYVLLKPNQQFSLEANVQPAQASQALTYKSNDKSIAEVNNGTITAKSIGSTFVTVSNEDTTVLVNLIVSTDDSFNNSEQSKNGDLFNSSGSIDALTEKIKKSTDKIIVVNGIDKISSSALKELYGTDKELIFECEDYDISIRGQDIFNADNEINTKLDISYEKNGTLIRLNNDDNLPGTINVKLKSDSENYKYLYMVDESSNEFQKLNSLVNNEFKINSVGMYLLSNKKVDGFRFNFIWILGMIGVILILFVVYIFTKKKYWLW